MTWLAQHWALPPLTILYLLLATRFNERGKRAPAKNAADARAVNIRELAIRIARNAAEKTKDAA